MAEEKTKVEVEVKAEKIKDEVGETKNKAGVEHKDKGGEKPLRAEIKEKAEKPGEKSG